MATRRVKVALVTGAGSGIGQATIIEFAKNGYNVVMTGRTRSKLETTANMCKAEGLTDDNLRIADGDVSKPEDNERLVAATLAKFNRLDVLVNNAGKFGLLDSFMDYPIERLDEHYKVSVRGMFDLTQKVMPHLLKVKGNIINVSSIAAIRPFPPNVGYSMMKACMDHFTRAISVEYAPKGVRINTVNPGIVKTTIFDETWPSDQRDAVIEAFGKSQPIGKCVTLHDTARVILFLASDDASFITGANIPVDGAWRNTIALTPADDDTK